MSDLWRARISTVDGPTVVLAVQMIHPDAGPIPSSSEFAVRLLADAAEKPEPERPGDVVESVALSDERNVSFDADAAFEDVERDVRASGLSPDDGDAWQDAVSAGWTALWDDPERVPTATLTVLLADPTWAEGLTPGTEWDSAAYD